MAQRGNHHRTPESQTPAFADVAYAVTACAALLIPLVFLLQRPKGAIDGVWFE